MATTAPSVQTKRRQLQDLLKEAEKIQEAWRGDDMPTDVGEDFEKKLKEAADLQREIEEVERDEKLAEHKGYMKGVSPRDVPSPRGKEDGDLLAPDIVGYLSPGQAFVESDAFNKYILEGKPERAGSKKFAIDGSIFGRTAYVPLDRKAFHARQKAIETKAVPTLSVSDATTFPVIEPQRLTEVVRVFEFERLVLRQLVTVSRTTSNSVEFPRITSSLPQTATTVADQLDTGTTKPESTLAINAATAPVRTLAVHMPVTEAQLEDFPQIQTLIDEWLRFDVMYLEEYQMVWGDGTGTDLLGIMQTPGVNEFTRVMTGQIGAGTTVTLLDQIRGAMTDVSTDQHMPNGLLVHPIDWEAIVLSKGSDDHYLRQVFPSEDGTLRVFSLRVVESLAAENYRGGLGTNQRVAVVGDFRRGAMLWDRHQTSVQVGYIDDQFIRNQRTLRAEERVAFAVWRPKAFRFIETVAASAS